MSVPIVCRLRERHGYSYGNKESERKLVCILWTEYFRRNQVERRHSDRVDYDLSDSWSYDGFVFDSQEFYEYYEADFH